MNRDHVVAMLGYLDRLGLVAAREGVTEAWHDVLSHVPVDDARAAARHLAASGIPDGRFHARPSDVLDAVKVIRQERVKAVLAGALPLPPPEIDADDTGPYFRWVKAFTRALGDGRMLYDAETVACEAAGIPPVHRPVEVHGAPGVRQIGGT